MYANGIYIQNISVERTDFLANGKFALVDKEYHGVARYDEFPLLGMKDAVNRSLSDRMAQGVYKDSSKDNDIIPLWVISDEKLYREYLSRCEELNIQTRVLFIESTRREPCWAGEMPVIHTLGYEVVNPNLGEVGLCWYLNQEQFKPFAEKLNEHGLFDDYETAEAFYNTLTEDPFVTEEEYPLIARISIVSI